MKWPAQDAHRLLMDITAAPSSRKVVVAHDAIRSREEPKVRCLDGAQNQGETRYDPLQPDAWRLKGPV